MIIFDFWTHKNKMKIDTTSVVLTIFTIVIVHPLIVNGLKVIVS